MLPISKIDILGYVAGLLVVLSLVPQFIKSWRTKMTRDISLLRYIVYCIGLVLWIVYAYLISAWPVAVMNFLGLVLAVGILYLKLRYSEETEALPK